MDDILFIVNPISGSSDKRRILTKLRTTGCRVECTQYAGHAEALAREATENIVVAVGGDGTVNEVARGLHFARENRVKHKPALGIIPCGSGDGLARTLGISRNFDKALQTVMDGRRKKLDCGTIDGRAFFSVCGVGLDAIVAQRFAQAGSRGLKTYVKVALAVWKHFKAENYKLTVDGKCYSFRAAFITAANSRQWGNGAWIAPHADCGDGLLDISIVDMFRSIEIPGLVLKLMTGRLDKSRRYTGLRGREIIIERLTEGPAHFDGDFFNAPARVEIRLEEGELDVLC